MRGGNFESHTALSLWEGICPIQALGADRAATEVVQRAGVPVSHEIEGFSI